MYTCVSVSEEDEVPLAEDLAGKHFTIPQVNYTPEKLSFSDRKLQFN